MSADNEEIANLRSKVSDLEFRLDRHFADLKVTTEQRDDFVLKATWGIVKAANVLFAVWGTIWLLRWLKLGGWVWGIAFWVILLVALYFIAGYLEKGQRADEGKLWRLPDWKARDLDD